MTWLSLWESWHRFKAVTERALSEPTNGWLTSPSGRGKGGFMIIDQIAFRTSHRALYCIA